MNKEQFWQIIDSVNQASPAADQETRLRRITEVLGQYPTPDIMDWHLIIREYTRAAYRDNLWRASSWIGAHDTDDGFIDFRYWLISRGKEVYMNALRDPASLTKVPLNGEKPNFELFGYTASSAYDAKQKVRALGLSKLYDELETHPLAPETVEAIWAEVPPGQIIGSLNDKVQEPQTIKELLESENMAIGYVYMGNQYAEYMFYNTPENIAYFLGSRPKASRMVVTDSLDQMILDTVGGFINRCPDQELLEEIKKTLIPIQTGEAEAKPLFCPTMDEVDEYCDQQLLEDDL